MTTPAEDCGVAAGCGACPLGRAGVCGDPETELPGMWEFADFTGGLDEVRGAPAIEATRITREEFDRLALQVGRGMNGQGAPAPGSSYFRVFDAPAHDPDPGPDRDPAEPRPADAGCCGGGCGG